MAFLEMDSREQYNAVRPFFTRTFNHHPNFSLITKIVAKFAQCGQHLGDYNYIQYRVLLTSSHFSTALIQILVFGETIGVYNSEILDCDALLKEVTEYVTPEDVELSTPIHGLRDEINRIYSGTAFEKSKLPTVFDKGSLDVLWKRFQHAEYLTFEQLSDGFIAVMIKKLGPLWSNLRKVLEDAKQYIDINHITEMSQLSHQSLDLFSLALFEGLRYSSCKGAHFTMSKRKANTAFSIQLDTGSTFDFHRPSLYNDKAIFGEQKDCTWKIRWSNNPEDMKRVLNIYEDSNLYFGWGVSQCPAKKLGFNLFKMYLMRLVEGFDWVEEGNNLKRRV